MLCNIRNGAGECVGKVHRELCKYTPGFARVLFFGWSNIDAECGMKDLFEILVDGEIHSGTEIGERLGITRAAIWKRMQKFQELTGLEVESLSGKGYRLKYKVDLLDGDKLQKIAGQNSEVLLLGSIDSTNEQAKRLIKAGSTVDVVLAEEQTQGKGRRGRLWQSPYGSNLYVSVVWPVTEGVRQLEGLSLAVGLAVLRTLDAVGVIGAGLKWPNDLLVDNKKIAGILVELVGDLADRSHVVIGIGINVNMLNASQHIGQPWTSISSVLGHAVSRHEVFGFLNTNLHKILQIQKTCGFSKLRQEWEARHLWRDKDVVLSSGDVVHEGRVTGINERGELAIETLQGLQYFAGGELSLRLASDSRA